MTPAERLADPGAQLERTALAWQRTALLIAVNGTLLARATSALGTLAVVFGGTTIAAAALIWLAASRGYRRGRGRPVASVLTAHARATRALTGLIIVIAAFNLSAVLLHG
ncbi:DUF202 domain-containing protein [Actinocorallia populi]|uniref:DUF202 domain-containing protein n=1 Tax=Actinocorallia populi TaxID=2079200 RepID=UPI0013008196|nr:DUF202 domain-containing protein [Actinocorallia populi]